LRYVFRNFPLTEIHPMAEPAAEAAEFAAGEGKYWEMHDILYENQNAWVSATDPLPNFESYARSIGLNITKFDTDYASDAVNGAINADLNAFNATGDEMATPTFYLDGKKVDNTKLIDSSNQPSVDAFSKVLDAELAQKASKS